MATKSGTWGLTVCELLCEKAVDELTKSKPDAAEPGLAPGGVTALTLGISLSSELF
jgi:hypothetical protein